MTSQEIDITSIVNAVINILTKRQNAVYKTDLNALTKGISKSVYSNYSTLFITLPDMQFIQQLASHGRSTHVTPAVQHVYDALSYGLELKINIHEHLLPSLPIEGLALLPIQLSDQLGNTIKLETAPVLGYQQVITLTGKWLITPKTTLVTPLAKDILIQNNIHLIKVR
ncbi:PduM family microcompartment protein [Vibrio algarum]|uniref:PduM family microcompartment protein n=1 Tax=Vibrio algarum TaxID=3020714 RepID=A0ABT4YUJ7_9VIBR|nr:PduM family microcompartment protein [Vibrio sp. KJ40-1]MDB1125259.1 PduM family microcompartment protein [Vibrio sp. KJ40-1]